MFFQHVYDKSLAQASYFIGCQKAGVAMVIDPKRDVDTYLEIAKQNNMTITHVAETHIHADFLSGARELAALTGAKLYLSDEGGPDWQYEFPHEGVKDGDVIKMGNLTFEVIHTPGHTPESISFLLTDHPASSKPVMLFTGDFVFVGDIGRPDLLEKAAGIKGTQDAGAHQMYQSIKRFAELPDYIQVWPGHGAGSACGKALGAVPSSTVGYEKIRNWALQYNNNEPGFVQYLLADQPEPPKYFAMMKKLNKVDRPLLTTVPKQQKLSTDALVANLNKGIKLIDARNKTEFAKGFIPGSLNIQGNNAFATWAGWFLEYNEPFMLVASDEQIEDLTRKLMRIGLDNVLGYVNDVTEWATQTGQELEQVKQLSLDEFKEKKEANNLQVVDLRGAAEFNSGHILGADHVFVGTLEKNLDKVSKERQVIIHCQGGDRASIAYSILAKHGYNNVLNYSPGMNEWVNTGNPVVSEN
ncbi:MAG: MBL fold metallo-hydrolase [Chitinophagales bacterium]|nr:MBL fold metallo-hydrolase [Chitinophagales bacterium]